MLEKVMRLIEKYLSPIGDKASNNRYLQSIMKGTMAMLPLMLVGALAVLIGKPPIPESLHESNNIIAKILVSWAQWGDNNLWIREIDNVTTGILGVSFTLAVAYFLSRHYQLNEIRSIAISGIIYFLIVAQPASITIDGVTGFHVNLSTLGTSGMFPGIVIAIGVVELVRFFEVKNIGINFPDSVPPFVKSSFNSILPAIAAVLLFLAVNGGLGFFDLNLPTLITKIFSPLINSLDNVFLLGILMLLINLFWFMGIHGGSIVMPLIIPIGIQNLAENIQNYSQGLPYDNIYSPPFQFAFVMIGGAGVFALALLTLFSKAKGLRQVGKVAFIPSLFNISEPTMFGVPIPYNTYLFIPFVTVPLINTFISVAAMDWLNIVPPAMVNVPSQTPVLLISFLSTASFKGVALAFINIVVDLIIYYPFFKAYEKKMIEEEELEMSKAG